MWKPSLCRKTALRRMLLTSSPSCFRSWCTPGQGRGVLRSCFSTAGQGVGASPRCSKCCFKRRSASHCFGSGASSPSTAAEYRPTNTARRRTLGFVDYQERYPRGPALSVLRDSVVTSSPRRYALRGVAPRNFTTLAAVDDIADVLHALGVNRVVVFGASYGSREALHFVRRHPEMVESMVLDGVAPPEATTLLDSGDDRELRTCHRVAHRGRLPQG